MGSKYFWIGLYAFVGLLVVSGSLVVFGYPMWGRTLLYPDTSEITKYAGVGEKKVYYAGEVVADPKAGGRPIFDRIENAASYSTDKYNIVVTPAQYELSQSVGKFVGFEEIVGSKDKYILLSDGETTYKYRVGFEPSYLFSSSTPLASRLFVEGVRWRREQESVNEVVKTAKSFVSDVGYEAMNKMIKKGDAIVVSPVYDAPAYAKKDEAGVYLVDSLIVRRVGGAKRWDKEIARVEKKL